MARTSYSETVTGGATARPLSIHSADLVDFRVGQLDVARRHLARDYFGQEQALVGCARHHRRPRDAAIENGLLAAQVELGLGRRAMAHHAFGLEYRLDIRVEPGRSGGGK